MNKVITETDDNFKTNNFNGIQISNKNNLISYNNIIPNYLNDNELSEKLMYLQSIVEKSPKLNLEVNHINKLHI